jgi:RimJ/RimL family protein N-acetyltransferase
MSYLADWDGQLPARVVLPDGIELTVRELHPSDEPALRAWFSTLSQHSRYHRFHGHVGELSPAHWRYLTRIDGLHHVAVIALRAGEVAGIARMIRLEQHRSAEIAFLIDDDLQRKRVGSLLRDVLFVLARSRAYRTLFAYVLPDNIAIRKLLAGVHTADRGSVLELAL